METIAEIVISALPWLEGVVSVARVVITAIPRYGGVGIVGALILFLFIFGADYLLEEEDWD